jgi:septal ring factor EnvC (AmiA/AmiB activator)
MTSKDFEYTAKMHQFYEFKKKLTELKQEYQKINKQFSDICDELDRQPLNETHIQQISINLTVYISMMNIIEQDIKEISQTIQILNSELFN